jgi:glutamate synthase (ferredoxin)
MNFMTFVAQELREIMAKLGVATVEELVGHTELLKKKQTLPSEGASAVDISGILNRGVENAVHFEPKAVYDFELEKTLDESVLLPAFKKTLRDGTPKTVSVKVSSTNRTFGTIFGSEITRKFGNTLPDDTVTILASGGGGQSFGSFIPKGMTIRLSGDSNDYFGKGLSGGKLVVSPPKESRINPGENIIIGNVALYGATSGQAYINGVAGERFCVRNSGARAVVEGVGDHGCEYMTGGCVVILGSTGKNFAAGMSGGIAYVLDERHELYLQLNKELVSMTAVTAKYDIAELKSMIERHVAETGSARGKTILEHWEETLPLFKKIMPNDYQKMLTAIGQLEERGIPRDQAELEAFYAVQKGGI